MKGKDAIHIYIASCLIPIVVAEDLTDRDSVAAISSCGTRETLHIDYIDHILPYTDLEKVCAHAPPQVISLGTNPDWLGQESLQNPGGCLGVGH